MAGNNWINRTTKAYLQHTSAWDMNSKYGRSDFNLFQSNDEWIYEPDMSAVIDQPNKYWVIIGDSVHLMDPVARAVVDETELEAEMDALADELTRTRSLMKAFAEVVLEQINTLRAEHGLSQATLAQLKAAVRSKL